GNGDGGGPCLRTTAVSRRFRRTRIASIRCRTSGAPRLEYVTGTLTRATLCSVALSTSHLQSLVGRNPHTHTVRRCRHSLIKRHGLGPGSPAADGRRPPRRCALCRSSGTSRRSTRVVVPNPAGSVNRECSHPRAPLRPLCQAIDLYGSGVPDLVRQRHEILQGLALLFDPPASSRGHVCVLEPVMGPHHVRGYLVSTNHLHERRARDPELTGSLRRSDLFWRSGDGHGLPPSNGNHNLPEQFAQLWRDGTGFGLLAGLLPV